MQNYFIVVSQMMVITQAHVYVRCTAVHALQRSCLLTSNFGKLMLYAVVSSTVEVDQRNGKEGGRDVVGLHDSFQLRVLR